MEEKRISSHEIHQKISQTLNIYINSLDNYTDEKFAVKHDENTWSLGEMYEHLSQSSSYFFLANIVRCLEKRKGQVGGAKTQAGDNIYFYGGFPPKKFKVPEEIKGPELVAKTREEYKILLAKVITDAAKLLDAVEQNDGVYKCVQPVFGWLNAYEWLSLLEMHTRHHLRQKKELESYI